jgi:hypothetical protein
VNTPGDLARALQDALSQWRGLSLDRLQYWERDTAELALIALAGLTLILLALRAAIGRRLGRESVSLPALVRMSRTRNAAWLRHAPLVPFAAGIPFLAIALADPFTPLISEDVSFPGRRISLMIDASTSMTTTFKTESLNTLSKSGAAFFTTVAAAERFVELRRHGRYRDLMALVEFGDQAYVITPFTNDYDNILLSIALIKDPVEFSRFPNRGTVIARALEQSLALFQAFEFLDASGNLMVIFTDGEDTTALDGGRRLDDILQSAVASKVPLYFVRTNYDKREGDIIPDTSWRQAVEKTGGKFYAVNDETTLLHAIADIDRVAAGTIRVRRYTSQRPQYAVFVLIVAGLWTVAGTTKLLLPQFQRLP